MSVSSVGVCDQSHSVGSGLVNNTGRRVGEHRVFIRQFQQSEADTRSMRTAPMAKKKYREKPGYLGVQRPRFEVQNRKE